MPLSQLSLTFGPIFLQCFDTVGWVIWLLKPVPIWPIMCWWDVKPYSINQSINYLQNAWMHCKTKFITDRSYQVHITLMTFSRSWLQRSRSQTTFLRELTFTFAIRRRKSTGAVLEENIWGGQKSWPFLVVAFKGKPTKSTTPTLQKTPPV